MAVRNLFYNHERIEEATKFPEFWMHLKALIKDN